MTRPGGRARQWWADGERAFGTALGRLVPEDFAGPSLLPGWTRAHVLAHVAGNADALVNLLTWARTGEETPMYASQVLPCGQCRVRYCQSRPVASLSTE